VAARVLAFLAERGRSPAICCQADIDAWLASGPTTRSSAWTFVRWAIRNRHMPKVDFPYRTARTRPILGQQERLELLGVLLDDEQRPLHMRVAAILLLLYAQPLTRVVRLTADRVSLDDAGVWVTFDHDPVAVPEPFADLVRRYIDARPNHRCPRLRLQRAGHRGPRRRCRTHLGHLRVVSFPQPTVRRRPGHARATTEAHLRGRSMTGMVRPPEMTADDVCRVLSLLDARDIRVWLEGGWAVDACLGSQTRRHSDLDIVIEERNAPVAVATLRDRGYAPVPRDDTRAWNFVLGDDHGHQVDFHVIVLDEQGHGIYGPPENDERYPAAALTGIGAVNGRVVACITPEWLVRFHTGYDVDATDWADVSALCKRFGIPVPDDYLPFQ
jgi:lincosamide nucleotidyltransferase A/C/D/E